MYVDPGELNKKIMIVAIDDTEKNKNGFRERKETVVRKAFAKVTRTKISEIMKAGREINLTKCRFLVRYSAKEVTRGMFVLYKRKYYQIEYVNNYGDSNEYIEIMTEGGSI